jgi:hypothetical protein
VQREPAVHPQHDGLAWPEPTAEQDLGVQAGHRRVDLAADHHQQPHRVHARRDGRCLLGLGHVPLVDYHHQGECDAARHRAAGAPFRGERLDDRRAGRVPQSCHR